MKITNNICSRPFLGIILLISSFCLCSFSLIPVDKQAAQPPVEKKKLSQKEKHQKRLQKRQNRLYERFEQAKSSKKRLFLQKKIRKIENQQDSNPASKMSIISFSTVLLALIIALGFIFITSSFKILLIIELLLSIVALTLSIIALFLAKKHPEGSLKGLAIAGLVISLLLLITTLYFLTALAILRII